MRDSMTKLKQLQYSLAHFDQPEVGRKSKGIIARNSNNENISCKRVENSAECYLSRLGSIYKTVLWLVCIHAKPTDTWYDKGEG